VRRALAISLMLIFSLPLVSSLLGERVAEADLPACCRRDGRHHCAMTAEELMQGSATHMVGEKCPYTPAAPAVVVLPSFTPTPAAMIFAGLIHHPAISPQTETQLRVSFDRVRQKRGPPAAPLS